MAPPVFRAALAAALLLCGPSLAQPAQPHGGIQAAPRTPVQKDPPRAPAHKEAPLIRPKPGSAGRPAHGPARPASKPGAGKPAARPAAPPPAPVPVVPAPAPAAAPEPEKAEPAKGTNTGLPLPRFAALRSDDVNLRTGPGIRYPIEWVYKRRDLPVQIEREFEIWRLVRDQEGVKGWVHQATLAPRRTAVIVGGEHALRSGASADAAVVARLQPGVILRLRSCEAGAEWCQAQVQDYRGWVKRTDIWGTSPGEAIQ